MARPPRQAGCPFPAGRRQRRLCTRAGQRAAEKIRPGLRRGQPRRRQRQHRHQRCRQEPAGWLHPACGVQHTGHQPRPVGTGALRRVQGLRAHHPGCRPARRAGHQPGSGSQNPAGPDQLRQGQPRQAQLRHSRRGFAAPLDHRVLCVTGGRLAVACAFQGPGPDRS